MFKIEKGVPLPPPVKNPRGAPTGPRNRQNNSYPLAHMEVGDSFKVPLSGEPNTQGVDRAFARIAGAAQQQKRNHGTRFTLRLDRKNDCVRCWRVA